MLNDYALLLTAIDFAARKHKDQRRKDVGASPYINHPVYVARLIADIANVKDAEILAAAILHDTLEDTDTSVEELVRLFGERVCKMVQEVTDDKQLPKHDRKQLQIEHAAHLTKGAAFVKLADKISNVEDVTHSPPSNWSTDRRRKYIDWAAKVVANCAHADARLKRRFNAIADEAYQRLNEHENLG